MQSRIACFGAAHLDRRARALEPIVAATSNPVTVRESAGGVARNVAENLARLGDDVALVTRVGRDRSGQLVAAMLTEAGVDTTWLDRSEDTHTASYTALLEPDGRLYVGLADMAIYDEMTPDTLYDAADELGSADGWVFDCNLPTDSLKWLADRAPEGALTVVNTVSTVKAVRAAAVLDSIDLLVVNHEEGMALSPGAGEESEVAARLREAGVGIVAVTDEGGGAYISGRGVSQFLPALDAEVRDVTGAGDAFTAALVHGLLAGRNLIVAAELGLAAAALTIESEDAVASDLDGTSVRRRAGLVEKDGP